MVNMTKYRKIATIDAEQFDGSTKMASKYGIIQFPSGFQSFLETKEGNMKVNKGDWIATGVDGEHWAIKDSIFRKTYEKVD